jgi:Flp pilus assembly protein TadD
MIAERIDDAYAWAREAIAQDPQFTVSYNTLGAVYHRHGNLAQSLTALQYAHALEPKNPRVMSNLVAVLNALGQSAEANRLSAELAQIEPYPPFVFFERGIAAMRRGEYGVAKEMFAKEVARAPYYHEFHYWLAAALVNLGDYELARKHMLLALEGSLSRGEREIYAAKLDRINAYRSSR